MSKVIFGIFAHPDDEAFGPGGTLIKEVHDGAQLHLLTLTAGEAGRNPDDYTDFAEVRLQEWRRSGSIIGASSMHFLGFKDGQLDNNDLQIAQQKILELVLEILGHQTEPAEIEFMTMDLNGITGHIDHIVAARAASYVFYQLRQQGRYQPTKLRYACLPDSRLPQPNTDWLYVEAGHPARQIQQTIQLHQYQDQIIAAIQAHHSQRDDAQQQLKQLDNVLVNHFIVVS